MARTVIFDVDGTLIDTVDMHADAWVETFRHFGLEVPHDAVRAQIGKGGDQLMPVFLPQETVDSQGEKIGEHRAKLFARKHLPHIKPFPKVRELFERIKADGSTIAVGSSAKSDELDRFLQIAGVADLVDHKANSDDADRSKPYPDIFLAVLEQLPRPSHESVVVVGDTPYDAIAAGKAGLACVGVLSGGFAYESLRDAGCLQIYRDPADILANYEESQLSPTRGVSVARTQIQVADAPPPP